MYFNNQNLIKKRFNILRSQNPKRNLSSMRKRKRRRKIRRKRRRKRMCKRTRIRALAHLNWGLKMGTDSRSRREKKKNLMNILSN
jgi:hypothetical protein